MSSWIPGADGSAFPLENLPYGVFRVAGGPDERPRVGTAIGDFVVDLGALAAAGGHRHAPLLTGMTLDGLLAAGPAAWREVRGWLTDLLGDRRWESGVRPHLVARDSVELLLPFTVADYVDFYSSEHHASNVGRLFRPNAAALPANWKHLPIGYHGRAGTVAVSGSPVVRPNGQRRDPASAGPSFGPSERLDLEVEVGFVVGVPSPGPVRVADFADHVFGVCLLNDWSARDVQSWETVPLGPFLGKSFLTSVSPWIVPLDALRHARVAPPPRDPEPLPYLRDVPGDPWGLDISLELEINGTVLSRPPFRSMYWTPAQQLAHLTCNGATLRTGDLFASGTVSGPEPDQRGCLLELSWGGAEPFRLADGSQRTFLEDGDEAVIRAWAPGPGGVRLGLGEVRGRVAPAS
ncbi:fumarylacetoacetase [Rugosimonospora acidiphila]|uniref:fumarylacetoacetase n=1 Tax=Rugosimonospora acidiphila TaxID=556531 RepID=A0ABP9SAW1_9ACTN